ncbi:MAG: hypothetical protein Q4G68_13690 [Planctomycetia bacterium]|nr:hypothetical protein [Planctomycetia bacterium]
MQTNKGFVLLLVLVMLAIAALLTTQTARRSLDQAILAARKQEELQRRWGEISLRHAVLNRAEILLQTAQLQDGIPHSTIRGVVKLGAATYELVLADEQAKMNLNVAYRYGKQAAVEQALFKEEVLLPVRLKPDPKADPNKLYPPAFASWGHLYDFVFLADIGNRQNFRPSQLGFLTTCWGNGQLNVKRADTDTIRMTCEWVVAPQAVTALLEFRQENPTMEFEMALKKVDMLERDRQLLRRILTDRSRCHSLWTTTTVLNQSWHRLDIKTSDSAEGMHIRAY